MLNLNHLAGAIAFLALAWLAMHALKGGRTGRRSDVSTLVKRAIVGIVAGLTTRVLVHDSGLEGSDLTVLAIPIGLGFAAALVYRG
jgi:hypothetical protein